MRRVLPLVVVFLAVFPATARAGGFVIDFSALGAQVYSFSDCDGYCPPQPVGLSVERDGAVIGTVAPATSVRFSGTLEAGDVVRILRDGTERAAVTYEGDRVFAGAPCLPVGATEISGSLRLGDPGADPYPPDRDGLVDPFTALLIFRGSGFVDRELSSPARWHAALSEPLATGGVVTVLNDYRIVTPVGSATVWAWHALQSCLPTVDVLPMPSPPIPAPAPAPAATPAPPSCAAALAADPATAVTVRHAARTLRLRALRRGRARLAGLPVCPGGTLRITVARRGRVLGSVTTASDAGTPKLRRVRRLDRRRATAIRVSVRLTDATGAVASWRASVTVR